MRVGDNIVVLLRRVWRWIVGASTGLVRIQEATEGIASAYGLEKLILNRSRGVYDSSIGTR